MKSPISVPCSCGNRINLKVVGSHLPEYADCPKCQASIYLVAPLGNIVTGLAMERAKQELTNEDATVTIILSAMAVEGEMSYLFFKWKGIDSGKLPIDRDQEDKDNWEREWDEMRSIGNRLDQLSRYLTDADFDKFAQQKKGLLSNLDGLNPAASVKKFFQEQLFECRNRIVHYGYLDFEKARSEQCFSLALALIRLLAAMDEVRIKRLDDSHEKQRNS